MNQQTGDYTTDIEVVIRDEVALIRPTAGDGEVTDLTGLALSGGGIRSASFALGVMQALAHRGWMRHFDYLSTVSGGGYIGASLSWLLAAGRGQDRDQATDFGLGNASFPLGTRRPGSRDDDDASRIAAGAELHKAARVTHIRQHGSYLNPDRHVTIWSLVAVVLRGLVVSVAVYLPMLIALMGLLHLGGLFAPLSGTPSPVVAQACADTTSTCSLQAVDGGCTLALATHRPCPPQPLPAWMTRGFTPMALLAALAIGIGSAVSLLYAVLTKVVRSGVPSGTGSGEAPPAMSAFDIRRGFDALSGWHVKLGIGLTVVLASLPVVDALLGGDAGGAGALTTLAGTLSALGVFRSWRFVPRALLVPVAATLLVYGLLLTTYAIANWAIDTQRLWWLPLLAGVIGAGIGWVTNINYLCVHRFYRDRLMEAFMMPRTPDAAADLASHRGDADRLSLRSLAEGGTVQRPYHLVNTHAVLVDSKEARYRLRGGDAFLLSPRWCGSAATGWRQTREFIEGRLTLATAMATSGAAVNPNTGVGGQGVTRSATLSALLVLLNLRLGFWVPNPSQPSVQAAKSNFLHPGLSALLASQSEDDQFVELSDGGHFENLGVYELLRRRCRVIVCVDGAADPDGNFADLANLIVRARGDLGVTIGIDAKDLAALSPHERGDAPPSAERGFAVGEIDYGHPDYRGVFIFITTTFVDGLSADLVSYKRLHAEFPDQPTGDQFFDEQQFEAYRELGFTLAERMHVGLDAQLQEKGIDAAGLLDRFRA